MIDLGLLIVWLDAVPTSLEYRFVRGPREPEYGRGDQVGVVTPVGGPGLTLEGAGELSGFQVKLTGREFQHDLIRRSAYEIDTALLFGDYGTDLWGTRVQYVDRTGEPPSALQEDNLDRVAYVCTYLVHETPER